MKGLSHILLVTMLLGMVLSACQPAAPTNIKVGLNVELTGSIPVVGESSKNAAELAVKEVNDAGGLDVGGTKYTIELLVEDNEDKAESAAAVAQKLATSGVLAMIGPNASRNAIPASVVAESSQMPMISPWSTNPKTTLVGDTKDPKQYVFRAAFIDDFQGVVAAKFAKDELKTTKPAVLYDVASEYNKGIAEVYKKALEDSGVQVVAFETYTTGDKDFSAQLTKIKDAGADSLFLPNYYSEVPL
ncbi:MAG TPA: ABC transporter substrate-binding protein, partial [Anaerolineales bacterium]|nr:ABC transporter substrate-binding protein [Anaerolineales bacterium]